MHCSLKENLGDRGFKPRNSWIPRGIVQPYRAPNDPATFLCSTITCKTCLLLQINAGLSSSLYLFKFRKCQHRDRILILPFSLFFSTPIFLIKIVIVTLKQRNNNQRRREMLKSDSFFRIYFLKFFLNFYQSYSNDPKIKDNFLHRRGSV